MLVNYFHPPLYYMFPFLRTLIITLTCQASRDDIFFPAMIFEIN